MIELPLGVSILNGDCDGAMAVDAATEAFIGTAAGGVGGGGGTSTAGGGGGGGGGGG